MVIDIPGELDIGGAEVVAGTHQTRAVTKGDGHVRAVGTGADAGGVQGCREVGVTSGPECGDIVQHAARVAGTEIDAESDRIRERHAVGGGHGASVSHDPVGEREVGRTDTSRGMIVNGAGHTHRAGAKIRRGSVETRCVVKNHRQGVAIGSGSLSRGEGQGRRRGTSCGETTDARQG